MSNNIEHIAFWVPSKPKFKRTYHVFSYKMVAKIEAVNKREARAIFQKEFPGKEIRMVKKLDWKDASKDELRSDIIDHYSKKYPIN